MQWHFVSSDIIHSGEGENERIKIEKKDFVSSLAEGVDVFKKLVHLLGQRCGAFFATELVIISDGAPWIKNLSESLFPRAIIILDWFHVTEHLWKCAKEMFGEKSNTCGDWVSKYKSMIWDGKIDTALNEIVCEAKSAKNQTPLRELHSYFNSRNKDMRYDKFREKGYYIGSGAIESANKYVIQDRLKRAGMKWTFKGANAIACLRTKYISENWDSIWRPGSPIFAYN